MAHSVDVEVFGIPVVLGGKQVGSLGLYHDISNLVRSSSQPHRNWKTLPAEVAEAPGIVAPEIEDGANSSA